MKPEHPLIPERPRMILKEYQKRTLATVREFLEGLAEWRGRATAALEIDPELDFDWVRKAWEKSVPARIYHPRRNGLGEPLPTFCLKIPTGGGKTLLATKVVDLVNTHYRKRQTGLVLWIVPTTQIYNQTLKALKDRDHPYRQQLDMASAGRTLTLEKTSGFGPRDVRENLCVLLLMLPSANRETREQLRMFRDSGGFDRFFPADDDVAAHRRLLDEVPNLDTFEQEGGFWGRHAKTSLGNTLRLLRPLIILDEGHKAYSRNARGTLEGFNPCMIVELSATPPKGANVLVDIQGRELNDEEMIKLDLHIRNSASTSWKHTLLASIEHRRRLEEEARTHEANTGVYIRPICLIQVERTGRDQRRPGVVHAEDVRDYLLRHPGIGEELIAVKTSQKDELKEVDEAGGLLSRECPVRFIITKQALQEGWDCSFAYVLAILTNPGSKSALTQLVGRILRQPYARKTRVPWLDECYVFCFQRRGADLLEEVRKGFGLEGLHDLEGRIVTDPEGGPARPSATVTLKQRERYRKAARDLLLPAFMIRDGREWRPVQYEADILSRVPWDEVDVSPLFDLPLGDETPRDVELLAGLDGGSRMVDVDPEGSEAAAGTSHAVRGRGVAGTLPSPPGRGAGGEGLGSRNLPVGGPKRLLPSPQTPLPGGEGLPLPSGGDIDYYFAASHLLDAMPNPWRGHEAARRVFGTLLERHPHERVAGNYVFILEELRKRLEAERDRLSRRVFEEMLAAGTMRFLVVTDELKLNRLPRTIDTTMGKQANREDGGQYLLNLFERTHEDELNGLENKVATYLDRQERLFFWYRNRARKDYYVQGWKRGRIYADFIFTLRPEEAGAAGERERRDEYHQVFVVETKGLHIKQSADTDYKRSVFDICTEHASRKEWAELAPAMRGKVMRFEIVDEDEWEQRLNAMLAA